MTGATGTAASDAGKKHSGNKGGTPTGGTSKARRGGSITATGNGTTGNAAACRVTDHTFHLPHSIRQYRTTIDKNAEPKHGPIDEPGSVSGEDRYATGLALNLNPPASSAAAPWGRVCPPNSLHFPMGADQTQRREESMIRKKKKANGEKARHWFQSRRRRNFTRRSIGAKTWNSRMNSLRRLA